MSIPDPGVQEVQNPLEKVAESPQSEEAPEIKPLLISFSHYNRKECQIEGINPKIAKKALRAIKDIGVTIKSETDFPSVLPKLTVKPVDPQGEYRNLYRGLADLPDVLIKEAKIDSDDSRLFFFMVDNLFNIIAVRESHYTTGKRGQ